MVGPIIVQNAHKMACWSSVPVLDHEIDGSEPLVVSDGGVGGPGFGRQEVSGDVDLSVVDGPVEGGVARLGVFGVQGRVFEPDQPLHQTLLAHRGCHLEQGSALLVNLKKMTKSTIQYTDICIYDRIVQRKC